MNIRQRTKKFIINFTEMCKTFNVPMLIGISIITFGLMFALNQVTEFRNDDLGHMLRWGTKRPTENFGDVIYSLQQHYYNTNGRIVAHLIARVLLWWQKPYSSILNGLIITILNIVLYRYSKSRSLFAFILSTTLMYFLNPDFEGTCNWISGSSNYIWTILIILLFLIPYFHLLENKTINGKLSVLLIPIMLFAGVIAGWTNENVGPTVLLMAIAIMIWTKKEKRSVPIWTSTGVIGLIAGVGMMLLAPGTSVRYEYIDDVVNEGYSPLKTLIVRCYYMERAIFNYLFPTLLLGGVLLLILVYLYKQRPDKVSIVFICAGIVSVGAMILSPTYPPRATIGSLCFFLVSILRITNQIVEKNEKVYRIFCSAVWFGYVAFIMQMLTKILYTVLKGV